MSDPKIKDDNDLIEIIDSFVEPPPDDAYSTARKKRLAVAIAEYEKCKPDYCWANLDGEDFV